MTNPNNSVGTNGAFGGRTSVNAFNDVMGAFSRGILSGWACVPNSGLTVSLGGNGTARDTAIAVDNAGNKTSINNISNSPINVTIGAAPGTNSRIDAIVAYVDNPPSGSETSTDNPDACGLIVVQGTTASSPVNPTDAQIRTGITADGASGTTAYYVVIAYITMASGTTDITANEITAGPSAIVGNGLVDTSSLGDKSVTAGKIDFSTIPNMVSANFGNGDNVSTTRTLLKQVAVSGFNTGWQYMCIVSIGLIYAHGAAGSVATMDLTIPSPETNITDNNRIRANGLQTTVSYCVPFTPPATSFAINLNGAGTDSGVYWEDAVAYFVPIKPVSL